MDKRTLTALKASIKHWRANVKAETPDKASVAEEACALCIKFIKNNCKGCPVKARTGRKHCLRSPYVAARRAWHGWASFGTATREQQWRTAAQAELDFLRSLLPQDRPALTGAESKEQR